jgi:hypothetical protein
MTAHVELLRGERAVRHLDAHHLVVAALPLPVDAVVEAEDAEAVLVELPVEVEGEHPVELLDVGERDRVDGAGSDLSDDGLAHGGLLQDGRRGSRGEGSKGRSAGATELVANQVGRDALGDRRGAATAEKLRSTRPHGWPVNHS